MRNWRKPVGEAVSATKHAEDTRHPLCLCSVDLKDLRMRVRGAQEHGIGLSRNAKVVGEPAVAGQQSSILLTANRLADRTKGHRRNVDRIVHARYLPDAVEREIENVEIA